MKVPKITFWRTFLLITLLTGLYFTVIRFYKGLGAVTNLSDKVPWGLWVGFDVICGVALAAGGFCLAATVYIFNLEKYRPILRSTILTAFLGYLLVCMGLMYDLGKPYNIWHPLIMWNPHSVMFEVAWCVMLYTTVLALEFSPVFFEGVERLFPELYRRFKINVIVDILHKVTIPLVIAGVILSTLHQSSLGSLFLIVPGKLYPLWYTPLLPVLFFISAVMVGLSMVNVESYISSRFLGKGIELDLLQGLSKANVFVIGIYLIVKFTDIAIRGNLMLIFKPTYEALLFIIEILVGCIVPIVMLSFRKIRESKKLLFIPHFLVVIGVIINRLNVSITGLEKSQGWYFPKFSEISISVFIVSIGFIAFWMAAKYLPVFPFEKAENVEQV